jgi:hypothetical protein
MYNNKNLREMLIEINNVLFLVTMLVYMAEMPSSASSLSKLLRNQTFDQLCGRDVF